ncbi:hypothetical protein KCU89_g15807, partial [Aureobasidium melanogenum]
LSLDNLTAPPQHHNTRTRFSPSTNTSNLSISTTHNTDNHNDLLQRARIRTPCPPRKHVLGDRTEFKGKPYTPPAPKPKVNYEEAFKLEGDTFRRKVNDPRFEDVEPPQVKGETAKPPFWMKWEMPKVEK